MQQALQICLKLSLVIFMVGNLLAMGLELALKDALAALGNLRFLVLSVVWGFVLCPALAWLLARVLPMDPSYAVGLLLMGMTPCAPFMPMMVRRARGDMAYAAAFMLVSAVGTVAFMPVAVPLMVKGLAVDAWTVARPLLFFVMLPLLVGLLIRAWAAAAAAWAFPLVKGITNAVTLFMLVVMIVLYGRGMLGAIASLAVVSQLLFLGAAMAASYAFGFGLKQNQRSVMSLGLCTRNFGAALAPLMAVKSAEPRATIMIVLGVPLTVLISALAALWFAGRARAAGAGRGSDTPMEAGVQ